MGYDYTCDVRLNDNCDLGGDRPAVAGQFRKQTWLTDDFGGRMQDMGYELGDTITICPSCAMELLATKS